MLTPVLPHVIGKSPLLRRFEDLDQQAQLALQGVDPSALPDPAVARPQVPNLPRLDPGIEKPVFNARRAKLNRNLALVGVIGSLIGSVVDDEATTQAGAGLATGAATANQLGAQQFREAQQRFDTIQRQAQQFNAQQGTREASMGFDLARTEFSQHLQGQREEARDERSAKKQQALQDRIFAREATMEQLRQEGRLNLEDVRTRNRIREIGTQQAAQQQREINVARTKQQEGLGSSRAKTGDFSSLAPEVLDREIGVIEQQLESGTITELKAGDTERFDREITRPLKTTERASLVKQLAQMKAAREQATAAAATSPEETAADMQEVRGLIRNDLQEAIQSGNGEVIMKAAQQAKDLGAITDEQFNRIRFNFGL